MQELWTMLLIEHCTPPSFQKVLPDRLTHHPIICRPQDWHILADCTCCRQWVSARAYLFIQCLSKRVFQHERAYVCKSENVKESEAWNETNNRICLPRYASILIYVRSVIYIKIKFSNWPTGHRNEKSPVFAKHCYILTYYNSIATR